IRKRPFERHEAPGHPPNRLRRGRVALDEMVGGERNAGAPADLERLRRRDPGDVVEVGDRGAVAPEAAVELAAERVRRRGEYLAAGLEMSRREAQEAHRVVHVLEHVADERELEALAEVALGG